jgi:bile-acid 7alpha-dehydratase
MDEDRLAALEQRIAWLEDLEAIRTLKHRYLRCLDTKDWDGLAATLAEDATTEYSDGEYRFRGRAAIMDFLRATPLARDGEFIGVHHGLQPEIRASGPDRALGTWALNNYLIHKSQGLGRRLCAVYEDEYVRADGRWWIAHTGYRRIFEEVWERSDSPSLKLTAG